MSARSDFVPLHVHGTHSLLDGLARPKDMAAKLAADGAVACAITDHGSLAGTFAHYKAMTAVGIKPILGLEAYLAIGSRFEKNSTLVPAEDDMDGGESSEGGTKRKSYEHLTMLAATREGWHNLVAGHNESWSHVYYKPRWDWGSMAQYSKGLIVGTGCLGGPVAGPLLRDDVTTARANLARLVDIYGKDGVFVEIMNHGIPAELKVIPYLVKFADEFGLPVVATNDSHYTHDCDADAHDAWLTVGSSKGGATKLVTDTDRFKFNGTGYHMRTAAEMHALFDNQPGTDRAVANSLLIAERVADDVLPVPDAGQYRLPKFDVPADFVPKHPKEGRTRAHEYLHEELVAGAKRRYLDPNNPDSRLPQQVKDDLRWEEDVITGAGMEDYFLITQDVIDYARREGVIIGPGRGSGPGSRALYCLGVTDVEPIRNNLLFERFLDPTRVGMPDVDLDFQASKQDLMFDYAVAKYGADHVARIGNNGISWAKDALKKYGRVTGRSALANDLATLIPDGGPAEDRPLRQLLALDPPPPGKKDVSCAPLIERYSSDPDAKALLDDAMKIEGVSASQGVHACGLVISSEPLSNLVPMRLDSKYHLPIVEWDKNEVEEFGLVKFDFLAIDTLDVIADAVQFIEDTTGEKIDTSDLDPDLLRSTERGKKTAAMIADGNTAGVFQLASSGMTELARNLRPEELADYSALVALYRPGPMADGMHERYARRRRGVEKVDYNYLTNDPAEQAAIAELLDPTLGCLVYQESVMSVAREMAGFDVGEVNVLRKAFSKKDAKKMASLQERFVAGGMGTTKADGTEKIAFKESTLRTLWRTFEGCAEYLFNACLTGDTQIVSDTGTRYTLAQAYDFHRTGSKWAPRKTLSYNRFGRLSHQPIKAVHYKGMAQVFTMTFVYGQPVSSTEDHRWLTSNGWKQLKDISVGDQVIVQGVGTEVATQVVTGIEPGDIEPVYDVEMAEGTDHNFVANGVVSHNSHSCVYGLVGYWTAYLKANWPVHYGAALLANTRAEKSKAAKRLSTIIDLRAQGIEVQAPLINTAAVSTSVSPDQQAVMLGLSEVAGVKSNAVHIIAERDRGGLFTSVQDFVDRVKTPDKNGDLTSSVSMAIVDALIEAGSFDEFGPRRGLLMASRADDCPALDIEWGPVERAARQRRRLGISVGEHPIRSVAHHLVHWREPGARGSKVMPLHKFETRDGAEVVTVGVVASIEERKGRYGSTMEFVLEGTQNALRARCKKVTWDKLMIDNENGKGRRPVAVGDIIGVRAGVRVKVLLEDAADGSSTDDEAAAEVEPTVELWCFSVFTDSMDAPGTPLTLAPDVVRTLVRGPVPAKKAAPKKPRAARVAEPVTVGANALAVVDVAAEPDTLFEVEPAPTPHLTLVPSPQDTVVIGRVPAKGKMGINVVPVNEYVNGEPTTHSIQLGDVMDRWPETLGGDCASWIKTPTPGGEYVCAPDKDGIRLVLRCDEN